MRRHIAGMRVVCQLKGVSIKALRNILEHHAMPFAPFANFRSMPENARPHSAQIVQQCLVDVDIPTIWD